MSGISARYFLGLTIDGHGQVCNVILKNKSEQWHGLLGRK